MSSPSFFVQCEKCDTKPATVRLSYGMQEKKICFQCERELIKEPFYREWSKQFLSYAELRPNRKSHKNLQLADTQDSRQFNTSSVRNTLKSPSTTTPHNLRSNLEATGTSLGDKSTDSRAYRSPVMRIDVPQRSRYGDTAGSQGDAVRERSGSRKKNRVYYSEYLKDYNTPKSEYRNMTDRTNRHDAISPYHSPKSIPEPNKYDRARSVAQIDNFTYTPQKDGLEGLRSNKLARSGQLEIKKDQIRSRLTQLAEKIYSPVKSPVKPMEARREYNVQENLGIVREQRDYKANVVSRGQTSDVKRRGNADYSNHANNIELLKRHIENLETRHIETISQLKEELRLAREELLKEKTENAWRNSQETSQLTKKVNELQKKLDEESSQNRLLKQELQQQKTLYEETIKGLKDELNRARLEKERRVEELSGLSKAQSKSHKDTLGQVQRDNEALVAKLKSENDFIMRDLNMQIDHKNQEIDRLKHEREEAVLGSAEKAKGNQYSRYQQDAGNRYQSAAGYGGSRGMGDSLRSRDNLMKKFDILHNKYNN